MGGVVEGDQKKRKGESKEVGERREMSQRDIRTLKRILLAYERKKEESMKKFLQGFVIVMMMVGLAGMGFAGTTAVTQGAVIGALPTIGVETLTIDRNFNIVNGSAQLGAVTYVPAVKLTAGNVIQLNLGAGLAFTGDTIVACAQNAAVAGQNFALGVAPAIVGGSTSANFNVTNEGLAAGNLTLVALQPFWFTSDPTCNAAGTNTFPIRILAGTPTGRKTISVVSGTEASASNNAANITPEFVPAFGAVPDTITINYGAGNGFTTVLNTSTPTLAGNTGKLVITKNALDYNVANTLPLLTARGTVTLTDSQGWQGVRSVFLNGAGATACNVAANVASNTAPSGSVTLALQGNAANGFDGTATSTMTVCVQVDGATVLNSRTISATYTPLGSSNTYATALGSTAIQSWTPNAYQGVIPYLITDTARVTYCLVNNSTTSAANVLLDVLSADGAAITGLTSLNMGSIAASSSKLVTFSGTDASLQDGSTVSVAALGTGLRYSGRLTVTGNQSSMFLNCFSVDSYGKKSIPVFTNQIPGRPWAE